MLTAEHLAIEAIVRHSHAMKALMALTSTPEKLAAFPARGVPPSAWGRWRWIGGRLLVARCPGMTAKIASSPGTSPRGERPCIVQPEPVVALRLYQAAKR